MGPWSAFHLEQEYIARNYLKCGHFIHAKPTNRLACHSRDPTSRFRPRRHTRISAYSSRGATSTKPSTGCEQSALEPVSAGVGPARAGAVFLFTSGVICLLPSVQKVWPQS